jgi:hypothetical protein
MSVIIPDRFNLYYLPGGTLDIDVLKQYWSEIVNEGLINFLPGHPKFKVSPTNSQIKEFIEITQFVFNERRIGKLERNKPISFYEDIMSRPSEKKMLICCLFYLGINSDQFKNFLRKRYEEQYELEMSDIADRPSNADEFVTSFIKWLPDNFPKIKR